MPHDNETVSLRLSPQDRFTLVLALKNRNVADLSLFRLMTLMGIVKELEFGGFHYVTGRRTYKMVTLSLTGLQVMVDALRDDAAGFLDRSASKHKRNLFVRLSGKLEGT